MPTIAEMFFDGILIFLQRRESLKIITITSEQLLMRLMLKIDTICRNCRLSGIT